MRLWSLHPKYLDSKGIVALWRETLLAKNVIENKTKGYKNHPQLIRFKRSQSPLKVINNYLLIVYNEALERNYNFDRSKFQLSGDVERIDVSDGQLVFELNHLRRKLSVRDIEKFNELSSVKIPDPNPVFRVVKGEVEEWERR